MATSTLVPTSIVSSSGFTGFTAANLAGLADSLQATGGVAGSGGVAHITDAPGDYGTLTSVVLRFRAWTSGTATRTKAITLTLEDASANVLATYGPINITSTATTYSNGPVSVAAQTAAEVDDWRLRVAVTEGGGMADSVTVLLDYMAVDPLTYEIASAGHDISFAGLIPLAVLAATLGAAPPVHEASFAGLVPLQTLTATVDHAPPSGGGMPFTAPFTGGTGQALQTFDATNWARVAGSGSDNLITQNNRVERPFGGSFGTEAWAMYRRVGGPTGDQYAKALILPGAGESTGSVALRVASGTDTAYLFRISQDFGRRIIRRVAGSETVLASAAGGITNGVSYTVEGRAIDDGDGHVHLEMFINDASVLTFEDTSGSRIASGEPGIHLLQSGFTADVVWLDDYEDDAIGGDDPPDDTDVSFAGIIPLQSLAATVARTPPNFDASFAGTVSLQSLAVDVDRTVPNFDASFAGTVPLQTLAATIVATEPGFAVAFAASVPLQALAATVARSLPDFDATFAGLIPTQVLAVSASRTVPNVDASFAGTIPLQTLAVSASVVAPGMNVAFSASIPTQTLAVGVARTVPNFDAAFAGAVPLQSLAAGVTSVPPTFAVTFSATVPLQSLAATITRTEPGDDDRVLGFAGTLPMQALAVDLLSEPQHPSQTHTAPGRKLAHAAADRELAHTAPARHLTHTVPRRDE